MPKSFNLPANWQSLVKDPRVVMRVVIGVLLIANLVMAVLAFKPFGGSAEDLARQQESQSATLSALTKQIHDTREMVEKVRVAREAGDQFLSKYFMNRTSTSSDIMSEVQRIATESGIGLGVESLQFSDIEGSNDMQMLNLQVGCEGSYQSLAKFVSLVEKSPRFLIIENLHAATIQNGQKVNVSFKIDTFAKRSTTEGDL